MKKSIAQMADEYAKKLCPKNEVGQIIRSTAYQLGARDAIMELLSWNDTRISIPPIVRVLCKTADSVHLGIRRSDGVWIVEDDSTLHSDDTIKGWRYIYEPNDAFDL